MKDGKLSWAAAVPGASNPAACRITDSVQEQQQQKEKQQQGEKRPLQHLRFIHFISLFHLQLGIKILECKIFAKGMPFWIHAAGADGLPVPY